MKLKNVLAILHLPPPIHGAAMVGKWIKESKIINEKLNIDYVNLSTSATLQEIGGGGLKKIVSFLKVFFSVFKILVQKKYDLYYVTLTAKGPGFYKDACVVFLLKLFKKNIIYHFHNKGVRLNGNSFLKRKIYTYVFNNTKSILLSKHLYQDISQYVSEKDVLYCPNGINDADFCFTDSKASKDFNLVCRFLFLSNMMEEKGVIILLEACALLREQNIKFECHFIGAWSDIKEEYFWSKVEQLALKNYIFMHGKKYNEDKYEFFKNSDVFVFPTYYHNETFGLVLVEAMQAYLPVISTLEGGIPDVVIDGKTGFLVEQKSTKSLAEKMKILSEDPNLRVEMGKAGYEHYVQNFTLEKFERNLLKILQNH